MSAGKRRRIPVPAANHEKEAIDLRKAAFIFAHGLSDPVSDEDEAGQRRNVALLNAAIGYTVRAIEHRARAMGVSPIQVCATLWGPT